VLRAACTQLRQWLDQGLPARRVCVNASPVQFTPHGFAPPGRRRIARHRARGGASEIEITESLLMKDEAWTRRMLEELRQQGCVGCDRRFRRRLLEPAPHQRLPGERLKIDRSFVQGRATRAQRSIVNASSPWRVR